MGYNSFKNMLKYKKIVHIEKKVEYLESIIENIKNSNYEISKDLNLDYKNSFFITNTKRVNLRKLGQTRPIYS